LAIGLRQRSYRPPNWIKGVPPGRGWRVGKEKGMEKGGKEGREGGGEKVFALVKIKSWVRACMGSVPGPNIKVSRFYGPQYI